METKVVLITGASAGIGLSAAEQLINKGVKVYAASRRGGKSYKAELGEGELIHVKMDVTKEEEIAVVVAQILKENKRVDAVISNAGNGVAPARISTGMGRIFSPLTVICGATFTMVSIKESSSPLVRELVVMSTIVLMATPKIVVNVWRRRPSR